MSRDDAIAFLESAFRNVALPPLSEDDIEDIRGGLDRACTRAVNTHDALVSALEAAAKWFDDYERQHRAKLTPEGNLKADTNAERAAYLRAALAQAKGEGA